MSLWESNKGREGTVAYITPSMIYRTMRGGVRAPVSVAELTSIVRSIQKMTLSRMTIEPDTSLKKQTERLEYREPQPLLHATWVKVKFRGGKKENQSLDCVKLVDATLLFKVSDSLNQIARVDVENLKSSLRYSPVVPQIRQYLFDYIEAITGRNTFKNNGLKYDTIYNAFLPLDAKDHDYRELRHKVRQTLEEFKENGYIADYAAGDNRKAHGKLYKITIEPVSKSKDKR